MARLNRMPGVRVVRNTDRGKMVPYHLRLAPNPPVILTGLGEGGADLVGIVLVTMGAGNEPGDTYRVGRAFALEVKWPGKTPRPDQARWLAAFRRFGGFAGVVHSVEEAVVAVARCRRGESQ